MAIGLKKIGVSAGVGLLDIIADELDFKKGYGKAFQNVTDWGRVAYVAGGYVANSMGLVDDDATEAAVLAGVPLLEKSIVNAVRQYTGILGVRPRGRMGLKLLNKGDMPPKKNRKPAGGTQIRYV